MGMSTHLSAFIPDTDATYQKHLRIWNMCQTEKVSLPKETETYFNGCGEPEEKLQVELEEGVHYKKYSDSHRCADGFEVFVDKLPKGVAKVRVENSY